MSKILPSPAPSSRGSSRTRLRAALIGACVLSPLAASAHVTLPAGGAAAGSVYTASFRVGHACKDATSTTELRVRMPAGFTVVDVPARAGWTTTRVGDEWVWKADSPANALPGAERGVFTVRGRLTETPGVLWFPVRQVCDRGTADWVQVPTREGESLPSPAARLEVLPAGIAAVDVREPWARATVAGQPATAVYARLSAPMGSRLVGGSSPLAGGVEVHEMRMEGDIMRMRALPDGLPLPAGEVAELRPGGLHLMVTGLKQALPAGSTLPLVLRFVDAQGREGLREVQVPVRLAPAASGSAAGGEHRHH